MQATVLIPSSPICPVRRREASYSVAKKLIKGDSKIYGGTLLPGRTNTQSNGATEICCRWNQRRASGFLQGGDGADRTAEAARPKRSRAWTKQTREGAGQDAGIETEREKRMKVDQGGGGGLRWSQIKKNGGTGS